MQTLRKKTSPLKYKNETSRFLGEGVSFKAKLIGILEVSEARGDRMCQEALSDLKMAIRAAGEHKQRITINIAIDGLRLRDEKTGDSLYHHPVHKISFIAQDMTDSRAFGYIFGSPDTGHRFFGIKTDKAASQVVIAMRDLFQVVFALKKKEIELAKQHLDKSRYSSSPLFSDSSISSSKNEQTPSGSQETNKTVSENKTNASSTENRSGGAAVADLVDLELELNSLQQGLTQMERITPSDPFGSKDDPFGDSFTNYTKPILPPPPSGRERTNRISESSSIFSPKTPHTAASIDTGSTADSSSLFASKDFSFTHDFNSSHDEPSSSGDWFTPPASNSIFEEPSLVPEPIKEIDKHEATKQEILSQFDVFTELDPLGTGRSKPYIDKKHFFQELKNPPKKVLNDLVSESNTSSTQQSQENNLFNANFGQENSNKTSSFPNSMIFGSDPFGEDPFKEDPFAEADFTKQDPFENELFNKESKTNNLQALIQSNLSKSPKGSSLSTSPRNVQFVKQNTFDVQFDDKKYSRLTQLHENPSLDLSSESECAPEPPPRPANNLMQIKPPPLPPKKQVGDLLIKPPPRPPHIEESHYDYMDNYETGPNSLEYIKTTEKSPPLPVPARKSKFESDFTIVPERPKKQFNLESSEEDYLTPISFPQQQYKKETKPIARNAGPVLLPPPQKSAKKQNPAQVTVASFLESKPHLTTSTATDKLNCSLEGLDITLSQLTLSGLNELANKLNIPPSQLSNMTLVQLTSYISNFIKNSNVNTNYNIVSETDTETPTFKADFAANFNNMNITTNTSNDNYDRYAVFRELLQEEIKQTKIDTEPEQILEEKEQKEKNSDIKPMNEELEKTDKYAALREIVESELKMNHEKETVEEQPETVHVEVVDQNNLNKESEDKETERENETNIIKSEQIILEEKDKEIIEYVTADNNNKNDTALKSPVNKSNNGRSPIPPAVTEIIQNNSHLTSGSLSDVVSGSSPEVDNNGSVSETRKKNVDVTGESWAIFDQPNTNQDVNKEKQQSEEGVSPWSSDSKEFANGSPPEWRQRVDSESGGDHWERRSGRRRDEGWWDTSVEPDVQYYPANRRSTDSYEEECYECYDRPRRQKRTNWSGHSESRGAAGGHSSSSRDVSPWEEEPRRREPKESGREHREPLRQGWSRYPRQHSFERHRDRRHTDSWDEEDDYEYEEEHSGRFHWPDRYSRESDRERHSGGSREENRWGDDWVDDRRHRRRRGEMDRERWCCSDWNQSEQDKLRHYSGRWSNSDGSSGKWREWKHEDHYYNRDSQESPWEDDYSNDPNETRTPHYLTAKRNWKRPSSASEMDRKTGDIKSRHYGTGGSDGERDRRYKANRRSKSRESHFTEMRHKVDAGLSQRNPHRTKQHLHSKAQFESEFTQEVPSKKPLDNSKSEISSNKKASTMASRKKTKEISKTEEITISTFPRKGTTRAQSLFENDFVPSETESPVSRTEKKFSFENDFETSEAESPIISKSKKTESTFESDFSSRQRLIKSRYQIKQKSLFEDDFSPSEKAEDVSISSIKEEETDTFGTNTFDRATNSRKKILNKNRLSNSGNLKKSESVNIFARENDPFDDDFFSGKSSDIQAGNDDKEKTSDIKWNEE